MSATIPINTAPVKITVLFAPAATTFGVRVRTGLSARSTNRARIIKLSAAACGNVPAGGRPSTDRNAQTLKGSLSTKSQ